MSGGFFDYRDNALDDFADQIQDVIDTNDEVPGEWSEVFGYKCEGLHASPETLEIMGKIRDELRRLGKLFHAFDWYASGDTTEEDFIRKAKELLS